MPYSEDFIASIAASILRQVTAAFEANGGCPHCLLRQIIIQGFGNYEFLYQDGELVLKDLGDLLKDVQKLERLPQSSCTMH